MTNAVTSHWQLLSGGTVDIADPGGLSPGMDVIMTSKNITVARLALKATDNASAVLTLTQEGTYEPANTWPFLRTFSYKITGSESWPLHVTTDDGGTLVVEVFFASGQHPTGPIGQYVGAEKSLDANPIIAPSVDPSAIDSATDGVWIISSASDDGGVTIVPPTAPTSTIQVESSSAAGHSFGLSRNLSSNSPTGTMSIPISGNDGVNVISFILRAAPSAPTINTQPLPATVLDGDQATFSVVATASGGTLSYQWKKNGVNVGTNSSTYYTGPTIRSRDHEALITVDVTDDNGTIVSNSVILTVLARPDGKRFHKTVQTTYDYSEAGWFSASMVGAGLFDKYLLLSVGAQTYTLQPLSGSFSLTGQAVNLLRNLRNVASAGSFGLNGQNAILKRLITIVPTVGNFTLTGQSTNLLRNSRAIASQGSFAVNGQSVNLLDNRRLFADQGSYVLSGQNATLFIVRVVAATFGSFTINGQSVNLIHQSFINPTFGAFAFAGQSVNLKANRVIAASQGSFSLSGQNSTLFVARSMTVNAGSFSLNGQDVNLIKSVIIQAAEGAYSLVGQSVNFTYSRTLVPTFGTFTLAGQTANLLRVLRQQVANGVFAMTGIDAAFVLSRRMIASFGQFTMTGESVNLLYSHRLASLTGAYSLTGFDANLVVITVKTLLADTGSFALNGQAINMLRNLRLVPTAGAFILAGQNAGLLKQRVPLQADAGLFELHGQDANEQTLRRLLASAGSFTLTGEDASFIRNQVLVAQFGAFTLTGIPANLLKQGGFEVSPDRIYLVAADNRVFDVTDDLRIVAVAADNRVHVATADARTNQTLH